MAVVNGKRSMSQRRFSSLSSSTNIAPADTAAAVEEVELHVLTQDVYVSVDGTAATSTNGFKVKADTRYTYRGDYANLYVIEASAGADVRAVFIGPKKAAYVSQ